VKPLCFPRFSRRFRLARRPFAAAGAAVAFGQVPVTTTEGAAVRRSLLTFFAVVGISFWISNLERADGVPSSAPQWVRTVDGWEPRVVVENHPRFIPPALHPGLMAAFLLGASVFCLLAFPAQAVALRPAPALAVPPPHRRRIRSAAGRIGPQS
jgi:hypothetical protein